jgi:hypothetical protein
MSARDDWSPDEPLGTETFEQGDEALDEESRLDPEFAEDVLGDPALDPSLAADDRELAEAGVELDDPEKMVTLEGDIDDPDGGGGPTGPDRQRDDDGWDLDEPLARGASSQDPGSEPSESPE